MDKELIDEFTQLLARRKEVITKSLPLIEELQEELAHCESDHDRIQTIIGNMHNGPYEEYAHYLRENEREMDRVAMSWVKV